MERFKSFPKQWPGSYHGIPDLIFATIFTGAVLPGRDDALPITSVFGSVFWAIFAIGFFLPWDERQYEKSSFLGNIYIYIVIFSKPPKKQIQVFQSMGFLESTFVTFCRTQVFLLRISDKVFGDPSLHPQSWNFKWSNQVTW